MNTNNIKTHLKKCSMTSNVIKGQKRSSKNSKSSFFAIYFLFNVRSFIKLFKIVNIMKKQFFDKIKYDLKH